jgi:hypothetical protein
VTWIDTHATTKASGGDYMCRISNNSTNSTTLDGIFTVYAGAGCTDLFHFEGENAPIVAGDATGGTKSYKIACSVGATAGYLQWYAA